MYRQERILSFHLLRITMPMRFPYEVFNYVAYNGNWSIFLSKSLIRILFADYNFVSIWSNVITFCVCFEYQWLYTDLTYSV